MEARQLSIEDFLASNKTRFIIPVYQRNYDWKEQNCLQLFQDIVNVGKNHQQKSHFIGSVVYVSNSDTDSIDFKEYVIIDGQQRITTCTLLLKALHDVTTDSNLKDEIYESYLINKRLEERYKFKLQPIKQDNEAFTLLLQNNFDNINKNSNIYINYNFFVNQIKEFDNDNVLYHGFKKLFLVHIALNRRDDNPQLIFESINSTGVNLSQSDLIRNFLLMDKSAEEQTRLFENYWFRIEKNLSSENISNFIRDFLTVKQNKIPTKDSIYDEFKSFIISNKLSTEQLLIELLEYAKIYKTLLFPSNEVYASNIKNFIQLKFSVANPFLLSIIKDYNYNKINQDNLLNILDLIESYFVRRMICNKPTNTLNKVFASLYNDIYKVSAGKLDNFYKHVATALLAKKGSAVFPDDSEFKQMFTTRDAYNLKNIKFLLLKLENKDNNEKVEITDLTIEHFMPQTLTTAWKVQLGDKYQIIHDRYLHNIGNLSLSGDNSQLGNKSFDEKKKILIEQSRLKLNSYFTSVEKWSEQEINDRSDVLFKSAELLWKYPKTIDILSNNGYEEKEFYTLNDSPNVTGKKIISMELFHEKYNLSSWKDLFVRVTKILLDKDKLTVETLIKDPDFIGKNRKIFSRNYDNINGKPIRFEVYDLYVETNLSAISIINYTKLLCEKAGLKNNDFIYEIS